jgi:rfaE bifunctional protein nucleotidyltransferase chain/domain
VPGKLKNLEDLKSIVLLAKRQGQKTVFTNGCFDILHRGHLHLLRQAKALGDLLIVAVNSDASVRQIKGPARPVITESGRTELLAALEMVDYVTLFDECDPCRLLNELQPDVLVKGGDWSKAGVVGADIVQRSGGTVVVVPYLNGFSTTQIIEKARR